VAGANRRTNGIDAVTCSTRVKLPQGGILTVRSLDCSRKSRQSRIPSTLKLSDLSWAQARRRAVEFIDRDLVCTTCGATFVFSAGEQQFYRQKGYVNLPRHCRRCRSGASVRPRAETLVTCSDCGKSTSVPFKPSQNRPVYCAECFVNHKQKQKSA